MNAILNDFKMIPKGLKSEVINRIKEDPILFGEVAAALNINPMSLPRLLYSNHSKLTQAAVLKILSDKMGVKQDTLLFS